MTVKCALCGEEINLLCDRYFEIKVNQYACGKCLDDVHHEHTGELLRNKLIEGGK